MKSLSKEVCYFFKSKYKNCWSEFTEYPMFKNSNKRYGKKPKQRIRDYNLDWIVPANPKYYDVCKAFEQSDEIIWKQSNNILAGDTIYISFKPIFGNYV